MEKKILFISSRLNAKNRNGAYVVANRNFSIIKNICETEIYNIKVKSKIQKFLNLLFFQRCEEITLSDENKILKILETNDIKIVFLDTSTYGFLCEKLKKIPEIKIIIFCHDINYFLYNSLLEETKVNLKKKLKMKFKIRNVELNEIKSFKNADSIITLNSRDSKLLNQKYNIKSIAEIPVSFLSKNIKETDNIFSPNDFNLLFVGVGGFFPNVQGIEFFIEKVLPYINAKLYIVGKNMENNKVKFENLNSKVKVIGTVDDLDKYYNSADAVIAPIFSGGGMKVKTAEALMYGKNIFGTTEAFEGYEIEYKKVGGLCNTPQEFIEKINLKIEEKKDGKFNKFNKYSRTMFLKKYSYEASEKIFNKILKEIE